MIDRFIGGQLMKKCAVVIVAVVLAAGACGSDGDDSSGDPEAAPPEVTGEGTSADDPKPAATVADQVDEAAIEVVVTAIDYKNDFDLDGWLAAHESGARQGIPLFAEQILMNANQHWEVTEPCRVTGENAAGDTVVECLITNTDDFWGAGEIYEPRELRFTVNGDGLITTDDLVMETNSFSSPQRDAFNRSFMWWLRNAHPEVFSEIDPGSMSSNAPGFETQDPDHMLIAIDYVDEFVAESADYPLKRASS